MAVLTKPNLPRTRTHSLQREDACGSSGAEWREALVGEYSSLVGGVVRKFAWCLPANIEIADLMSAAWLGLLDAAAKFDPTKSPHFESYARIRIQGAIQDELRKMDWVPRSVRKNLSEITRATRRLEQERGRPVREEEVAEELKMRLGEYWRVAEIASLIDLLETGELESLKARNIPELANLRLTNAQEEMERQRLWEAIEQALPSLLPKEETVLRLHYFEGKKLKEIGQILHLSESRISQLHAQALRRLQIRLGVSVQS